jgi:hypothetical protein
MSIILDFIDISLEYIDAMDMSPKPPIVKRARGGFQQSAALRCLPAHTSERRLLQRPENCDVTVT